LICLVWRHQWQASDASDGKHFPATPENFTNATAENIKYYQQLIGSFLFLALIIRINICFIVIKLARFVSNFSEIYFGVIKRIFRYLKNILNLGIIYNKYVSFYIQGYCDVDYTRDQLEVKFISGYYLFIIGDLFMWKSKLQSVIA
jgi:hypothetical protein